MDVSIRAAREDDAPAMAKVMVDTWLAAHRNHMPDAAWQKRKREWTYAVSERGWRRTLREIVAEADTVEFVFIALDAAGMVLGITAGGRAEADVGVGEIRSLYVDVAHQGRDIGRRLVQTAAAHLARSGMSALIIGVWAANGAARAFYEALGGRVIGEREFDEEGLLLLEIVYGWTDIRTLVVNDP